MHLNVRVGALRLWPAGQRGGRRRSPTNGGAARRGVAVQASILWADVEEQGMRKCAEFNRQQRGVGAGALGPGPGTWGVRWE